jgi:enamine deaminase RidA (YjgF/YER057c/UK114 family)
LALGYTQTQVIATFQNLEQQLRKCNTTFKDVVKMNTYIVILIKKPICRFLEEIKTDFLGNENYQTSTLVGVSVWVIKIGSLKLQAIAYWNKYRLK